MKLRQYRKVLLAGVAGILGLIMSSFASAENCFTAFNGDVYYQFDITTAELKAKGTSTFGGRTFGKLVTCAGLNWWPITATKVRKGNKIILAFRAMTVDSNNCGAVDHIVTLNPVTLSGPLELHNDRKNFGNSSTLVPAACIVPSSVASFATFGSGETDPQGNVMP
jgi:hypothetical protein